MGAGGEWRGRLRVASGTAAVNGSVRTAGRFLMASRVGNVVIVRGRVQNLTFPTVGVGFVSCARARGAIATFPTRAKPAPRGARG
jgi:hypothetical protein